MFLTQALKAEATAGLASAPEIVVQRVSAGRHETIPLHYRDKIRDLPGVQAVTPRVWGYYYDTLIKANLTLMGVNDAAGELDLLRGRLPAQALECAVGRGLVSAFGAELGDLLALEDSRGETLAYRIVGVFNAQSNLLTNDLVVLTEKSLREFFAQDASLATDLVVRVYNPREVKTVAKKIKYLLPDTRPITRDEIIHTYATLFNWRSGMMLAVSVAALIAFCILAWGQGHGTQPRRKTADCRAESARLGNRRRPGGQVVGRIGGFCRGFASGAACGLGSCFRFLRSGSDPVAQGLVGCFSPPTSYLRVSIFISCWFWPC